MRRGNGIYFIGTFLEVPMSEEVNNEKEAMSQSGRENIPGEEQPLQRT